MIKNFGKIPYDWKKKHGKNTKSLKKTLEKITKWLKNIEKIPNYSKNVGKEYHVIEKNIGKISNDWKKTLGKNTKWWKTLEKYQMTEKKTLGKRPNDKKNRK